jgi:hypothetical protein
MNDKSEHDDQSTEKAAVTLPGIVEGNPAIGP